MQGGLRGCLWTLLEGVLLGGERRLLFKLLLSLWRLLFCLEIVLGLGCFGNRLVLGLKSRLVDPDLLHVGVVAGKTQFFLLYLVFRQFGRITFF